MRFFLLFVLVFSVTATVGHAWESNGYSGTASALHLGTKLSLEGRLDSGPRCQSVRIDAQLADNTGQLLGRFFIVEGWEGWGSKLISSAKYSVSSKKTSWHVVWVQAKCQN